MSVRARIGRWLATVLLASATLTAASPGVAPADSTYFPPALAKLTNARYGHDCFWAPPKGTDYGDLPGALPIQKPNLYPDVGSTYFVAQYVLPAGASLTFHGRFPKQRYLSWTMFRAVGGGQLGPGDHLTDVQIVPDRGSVNPFLPRNSRNAKPRAYTMHVVSGAIPAARARNTIYTQTTDPTARLGMSIRNYLPDRGRDGTGGAGLPKLTLNLADGTRLAGRAACDALQPTFEPSTSTFPQEAWKALVAGSSDPANAPAENPPKWERFWNAAYSVAGAFIDDEAARQALYPPDDVGGFQSNPDTRYLITQLSLEFGQVVTVNGKLPTFPRTLPTSRRWKPSSWQLRYWSLCSGSSPVSGLGYDCVFDQQLPLRGDRRYTLVVSRRRDRPKNATEACGYKWLDFGAGENYPDAASRDYVGVLYARFMFPDPAWAQAPQKVTTPGTERAVMGPYFPRSRYTTTARFERRGCRRGAHGASARG
jgi:hypothetical protein